MTLEEARNIVIFDCSTDLDPIVTNDQVDLVLGRCAIADSDGLAPSHDDWAGAYDLDLAKALVYERKAALVSQQVDFKRDGGSFELRQRYEGYMAAAKACRNRRHGGAPIDFGGDEEAAVELVEW